MVNARGEKWTNLILGHGTRHTKMRDSYDVIINQKSLGCYRRTAPKSRGVNIAVARLHAQHGIRAIHSRCLRSCFQLASTMSSPAPYKQWKLFGMCCGRLKRSCLTIIQGLCIDDAKKGKQYYADIVVIDRSQRETIAERLRVFSSAEKKEHDPVRS
jgi:hypothetical protein